MRSESLTDYFLSGYFCIVVALLFGSMGYLLWLIIEQTGVIGLIQMFVATVSVAIVLCAVLTSVGWLATYVIKYALINNGESQ